MITNPQTEARAIAQTSLWVPAKPEHAKIGWTYDFEQTERISRAAYDSTGYEATMEVVEFVMAEADRRHATALAAKDADLDGWKNTATEYAAELHVLRVQLAEANKALEPFARFAELGDVATMKSLGMKPDAYHIGDSDTVATGGRRGHESYRKITWGDLRIARRAREQGGE